MLSDKELGVAAVIVAAALYVACLAIVESIDKGRRRKRQRIESKARMYQMRRDRMPVRFEDYEREKAKYRLRRDTELFGHIEHMPIRKACGLFSDAAAQEVVR